MPPRSVLSFHTAPPYRKPSSCSNGKHSRRCERSVRLSPIHILAENTMCRCPGSPGSPQLRVWGWSVGSQCPALEARFKAALLSP